MTLRHIYQTEDPALRKKRQAALYRRCLLRRETARGGK